MARRKKKARSASPSKRGSTNSLGAVGPLITTQTSATATTTTATASTTTSATNARNTKENISPQATERTIESRRKGKSKRKRRQLQHTSSLSDLSPQNFNKSLGDISQDLSRYYDQAANMPSSDEDGAFEKATLSSLTTTRASPGKSDSKGEISRGMRANVQGVYLARVFHPRRTTTHAANATLIATFRAQNATSTPARLLDVGLSHAGGSG